MLVAEGRGGGGPRDEGISCALLLRHILTMTRCVQGSCAASRVDTVHPGAPMWTPREQLVPTSARVASDSPGWFGTPSVEAIGEASRVTDAPPTHALAAWNQPGQAVGNGVRPHGFRCSGRGRHSGLRATTSTCNEWAHRCLHGAAVAPEPMAAIHIGLAEGSEGNARAPFRRRGGTHVGCGISRGKRPCCRLERAPQPVQERIRLVCSLNHERAAAAMAWELARRLTRVGGTDGGFEGSLPRAGYEAALACSSGHRPREPPRYTLS